MGDNVVQISKNLIKQFITDNFGEEKALEIEKIIDNVPINYVSNEKLSELNAGAYVKDGELYIPKIYLNYKTKEEWALDKIIGTIIHEYGHILRKVNSKYDFKLEEGFVTIFAQTCIMHNKIKNNQSDEVFSTTSRDYKKAESQVKSILHILKQHEEGLDIQLLGEYIFGDEEKFIKKCIEVFGDDFSNYFSIASSGEDEYYNFEEKSKNNSEYILIKLLTDYIKKNSFDLTKFYGSKSIYEKYSKTLYKSIVKAGKSSFKKEDEKVFNIIKQDYDEIEKEDKEIEDIKFEKIKEKYDIFGKSSSQIYSIIYDMCFDYMNYKNMTYIKEKKMIIRYIEKMIPNIEELAIDLFELRKLAIINKIDVEKLFENETINFENVTEIISSKLIELKEQIKKQNTKKVKHIFDNCKTKEKLISIIKEINSYELNMDDILNNYSDFIKFYEETLDMIPNEFDKSKSWNYETIYSLLLELYIQKEERKLDEDAKEETDLIEKNKNIDINLKVIDNREIYEKVKKKDSKFKSEISILDGNKENKKIEIKKKEEEKEKLYKELDSLNQKNFIIKLFKRKQIKSLETIIENLEIEIENNNMSINEIESLIKKKRQEIIKNEEVLYSICGMNLEKYEEIYIKCVESKLTSEILQRKRKENEEKIKKLNIEERKKQLSEIKRKNIIIENEENNVISL